MKFWTIAPADIEPNNPPFEEESSLPIPRKGRVVMLVRGMVMECIIGIDGGQ